MLFRSGLLSDRFTQRGRRGRLLFVGLMVPILIGGFYMVFDPPDSWFGNQPLMAVWLTAALLLVHFGYSGVSISYHSHGAELTDDYNERTKVTVGREVFGMLGFAVAVVLPTILTDTSMFGETQGYIVLGIIFIPIAVVFSLPCLLWAGPSVHPPVTHANRNPFVTFFAPLKNRLFRRLLLIFDPTLDQPKLRELATLMAEEGVVSPDQIDSQVVTTATRLRQVYGIDVGGS